jgi:hypothetical protein
VKKKNHKHKPKKYSSHRKINLSLVNPKCVHHSNKTSEFFCFDHKLALCAVCVFNKHKDVEIHEATKAFQEEQKKFPINKKIQTINDSIQKMNEIMEKKKNCV